jgi:hypothetical protein
MGVSQAQEAKQFELVARKAAIEQVREEYAFQSAAGVRSDDHGGIELSLAEQAYR